MKPDSIAETYRKLLQDRDKLHPKLQKLVPTEPPKDIQFDALLKEDHDSIPNYVRTKTLYRALDNQLDIPDRTESSPVICVFCQPAEELGKAQFPFVPVSYCAWLEAAGARCVALPYNINEASMEYLLESTNGLLVPGGNSNLYKNYETKEGSGEVTLGFRKVWRLVNKMWARGVRYPVWGTCLGLELVLMMITEDTKVLSTLNSRNHTSEVWAHYEDSLIFRDMPTQIRLNIENRKLLNFFHRHGISLNRFLYNEKYDKLRKELKLIGTSKDKDGTWFCSFLEGIRNPIFISQFHPEKQAYEWNPTAVINHHYEAIEASQYFANQFVEQCRKCPNKFASKEEEWYHLIYQYVPQFEQEKHFQTYFIDLRFRKNKDLKNPKLKRSKNELPSVAQSTRKLEEEEETYS